MDIRGWTVVAIVHAILSWLQNDGSSIVEPDALVVFRLLALKTTKASDRNISESCFL